MFSPTWAYGLIFQLFVEEAYFRGWVYTRERGGIRCFLHDRNIESKHVSKHIRDPWETRRLSSRNDEVISVQINKKRQRYTIVMVVYGEIHSMKVHVTLNKVVGSIVASSKCRWTLRIFQIKFQWLIPANLWLIWDLMDVEVSNEIWNRRCVSLIYGM